MKAPYLPLILIVLALAPLAPAEEVPEGLTSSDWQSIRAAYEAGQHAFTPTETGWRARNPGQRWTTEFDGRGFLATPDEGDWTWGLEMELPVTGEVRLEGNRLSLPRGEGLEEWFVNDARGLEQGWTFHQRPEDLKGPLRLELKVRGGLEARVSDHSVGFGEGVLTYGGLKAWDATGRPLAVRFLGGGERIAVEVEEAGAVYPVTVDPVAQQAYLKAGNTEADDRFGYSVAIWGDTVVVGAPHERSNETGVVNGTGGFSDNSAFQAGAVYVFVRDSSFWVQQACLKAGNTDAEDYFGGSVAVYADTIVVGAPGESSIETGVSNGAGGSVDNSADAAGAAFVFVRAGSTWSQQAYLKAGNTGAGDQFGNAVSISGDTVVVGALYEESNATGVTNGSGGSTNNSTTGAGAAFVFEREGTTWSQQAYLKAGNTDASDYFGFSVSVSGDTIIIGAPFERSNETGVENGPGGSTDNSNFAAGAAYVFVRDGTTWSQQAYLKAGNSGAEDQFGNAVAISDDTVVVGARGESSNAIGVSNGPGGSADDSAYQAGAAYVFVRNNSSWSQQAYLKAGNTDPADYFGYSVATSGDLIVIGALFEDSSATGVINGPDGSADNSSHAPGAAYLFVREGMNWGQRAYLKAGNTGSSDNFGSSVAVSDDTAIVGAHYESSGATGVLNGPGGSTDNNASRAGAAYIFLFEANTPPQPNLTLTRPRLFPTTTIGKRGKPQTIRVTNSGGTTATGITARLSGKAAKDFLLTRPADTLAPGAATSFRATFRPRAKGARKATATVSASNAAATSVPLKGRGK